MESWRSSHREAPQARRGARAEAVRARRAAGRGELEASRSWEAPPLADGPIMTQSAVADHRNLRITVTKGLSHPWAMAFLPDGGILVTERAGRLRLIRNGVLQAEPIAGVPAVAGGFLNGLMDIALHPQFAKNGWIYFTYHKPVGPPPAPAAAAPAAGAQAGPVAVVAARSNSS